MDERIVKLAEHQAAGIGEDGLALAFATAHAVDLRYVAKWGQWLSWNGTRWAPDDTLQTFDRIRALCREMSTKAGAQTVAAVERLARSDRRVAAVSYQWDASVALFNTPTGVVDLTTGMLRPHRPEDFLIKTAAVGPDNSCPTPLWTAFLKRVTGGNRELAGFIQRALGYSLTGEIREHAMFFARRGRGARPRRRRSLIAQR